MFGGIYFGQSYFAGVVLQQIIDAACALASGQTTPTLLSETVLFPCAVADAVTTPLLLTDAPLNP